MLENRQPVFIPENALSDPRIKYFPELEEEKYQSLVSVPLVIKGDHVIGVIALHAEAPRVFSSDDAAFLIHTASLVAGAIENARLYERTRRSLRELEQLSRLGLTIARAETVDELLAATVEHGVELLRAESLRVYLIEPSGDRLRLRASTRDDGDGPEIVSLPELGSELRRSAAGGGSLTSLLASTLWGAPAMHSALVAPLVTGDEVLGFLVARLDDQGRAREHERDVANSVASQTAVGLKRLQLTDRLAERNLIKDLFDDLADGTAGSAVAARARRLGVDLDAPHVALTCLPAPAAPASASAEASASPAVEAFELALVRAIPAATVDRRDELLRALVPVGAAGEDAVLRGSRRCSGRRTSRPACRARAAGRRRARLRWPRRARRPRVPVVGGPAACCATRTSASTSTSCACRSRIACATATAMPCGACATTTAAARASCCARSRSSCASAATWPRPPRRSTSTPTRCASGCAGSPT